MTEKTKNSYPTIAEKNWWSLREIFKQRIPNNLSPNYVSTSLNMKETSAKANIIPAFVACKIVDEKGKPLERAKMWRDDENYKKVCEAIIKEIYPQELLDIYSSATDKNDAVKRWFLNTTGVGETASWKFAQFFLLLKEPDVSKAKEILSKKKTTRKSKKTTDAIVKKEEIIESPPKVMTENDQGKGQVINGLSKINPSIHIDLQIHISPDAGSEQIEQIFKNIAKYLVN